MDSKYRYFATIDGGQVVVDKSGQPDVSWYEHKAAREVVLADPKDVVIRAADLPKVTKAHTENVWNVETGETYHYLDLEDAERDLRNAAAVVQAMRLAEEQERKAEAAKVQEQAVEMTNVLLEHSKGHIETIGDMEDLSQRLVQAGYKIVKEG